MAIETRSNVNISLAFVESRVLDHEMWVANRNEDTSVKVLSAETVNENSKKIKLVKDGFKKIKQ